ncbi:MAG: MAPEG family protein [Proteobacteria bacterium]|nr:MAPEG family protein [Pseudomonadota bacterium]
MTTSLYAAILVIILIVLSAKVIGARRSAGASLNDGNDDKLKRRIRAHGNFVEYTPIFLLTLLITELQGLEGVYLNLFGSLFVIGRTLHAYGIVESETKNKNFLYRQSGMFCTFFCLGSLALILLIQFLLSD